MSNKSRPKKKAIGKNTGGEAVKLGNPGSQEAVEKAPVVVVGQQGKAKSKQSGSSDKGFGAAQSKFSTISASRPSFPKGSVITIFEPRVKADKDENGILRPSVAIRYSYVYCVGPRGSAACGLFSVNVAAPIEQQLRLAELDQTGVNSILFEGGGFAANFIDYLNVVGHHYALWSFLNRLLQYSNVTVNASLRTGQRTSRILSEFANNVPGLKQRVNILAQALEHHYLPPERREWITQVYVPVSLFGASPNGGVVQVNVPVIPVHRRKIDPDRQDAYTVETRLFARGEDRRLVTDSLVTVIREFQENELVTTFAQAFRGAFPKEFEITGLRQVKVEPGQATSFQENIYYNWPLLYKKGDGEDVREVRSQESRAQTVTLHINPGTEVTDADLFALTPYFGEKGIEVAGVEVPSIAGFYPGFLIPWFECKTRGVCNGVYIYKKVEEGDLGYGGSFYDLFAVDTWQEVSTIYSRFHFQRLNDLRDYTILGDSHQSHKDYIPVGHRALQVILGESLRNIYRADQIGQSIVQKVNKF